MLEAAADENERGEYSVRFTQEALPRFDWRIMLREMKADMDAGVSAAAAAAKFMNTLCTMALESCRMAREKTGLERVVLSGGSFQNMYIMHRLPELLRRDGFEVYHHSRVSPNDEGISLGQLMIAAHRGRKRG